MHPSQQNCYPTTSQMQN